jgi:signal transduction histidine kinase
MSDTDLQKTLQAYTRLVDVARDLASTLELDTLLKRIVQLAADFNDAEQASILLYDAKRQQLYFQASTDTANVAELRGITIPAESIAGFVAINREPVIVADVSQDTRFFRNISKLVNFKTRSIVAVPMITKDKLIGVLEVLNKRSETFTSLDQEILSVLAGQAAVAIENARLFHQSDLISELVHELRTPLGSITTITYLMQRQGMPEAQRIALAQTIQVEAQRLNELSSSFLDLARLESGRSEFHTTAFDPALLLRECCELTLTSADQRQITLEVDAASGLPPVTADRDKIKQVLLNLLSNAVKYNRPEGQIVARTWQQDQQIGFSIADTGAGMSPEQISHLFEKFFRANPNDPTIPGTGLGLYICKKIIESHNGQIQSHSTVGVGTTFEIFLPLAP